MSNLEQRASDLMDKPAANTGPIGSPRHFVLACIGMLSLLADEIPAVLERSVQRGAAVLERAQDEAQRRRRVAPTAAQSIDQALQHELSRLGLPTHQDFQTLLEQVTALEHQIDQIAARRSAVR